jgi:hypothetical protein
MSKPARSAARHPLTLLLAWLARHIRSREAALAPRFNLISAKLHQRTFAALRSPALSERVERELTPIWNVDAVLRSTTEELERNSLLSALRSPLQLALAALIWPRRMDTRSGWERIRAAIATMEQVFSVRWAYWFYVTTPHWPLRDCPLVIIVFECNVEMLSSIAADERPFLALVVTVQLPGSGPPLRAHEVAASYSVLRMADMLNVDPSKHWRPPTTSFAAAKLLTIGWLPPTLFQAMPEPTFRYRPLDDNTALAPLVTIDAEALDAAHVGEGLDESDPPV